MTPTAVACADIVLPAAMSCERNSASRVVVAAALHRRR